MVSISVLVDKPKPICPLYTIFILSKLNDLHFSEDVEIEKQERRKARYQGRSPSPLTSFTSSGAVIQMETPFPSLPLPSVSPMASNLNCTNEKVSFLNGLGLKRASPTEKKGWLYCYLIAYGVF